MGPAGIDLHGPNIKPQPVSVRQRNNPLASRRRPYKDDGERDSPRGSRVWPGKKMDSALALAAGGRPVKLVCEVLGVSRSNVSARLSRPATWRDGRQSRQTDDASVVEEIRRVVGDLPSYGYRRVWGTLRNERVALGLVPFNAKRVYRVMRTHGLLMQRRQIPARPQRRHDGKVAVARSNQRWCSDVSAKSSTPYRESFATQRRARPHRGGLA